MKVKVLDHYILKIMMKLRQVFLAVYVCQKSVSSYVVCSYVVCSYVVCSYVVVTKEACLV